MPNINARPFPKVLIVAEHASAVFGGEALIPFQYFRCFREMGIDVHLLVHERTRAELEKAFSSDLDRLHFVNDSLLSKSCAKLSMFMRSGLIGLIAGTIIHLDTQIGQRRLARQLIAQHGFEIIHEPIPVSPKTPSLLFGLPAAVVIGPMNGGMNYPPNYNLDGRLHRFIRFCLRSTAGIWNRILPGKHQAALLLVANRRTYDALPKSLRGKFVRQLVENGVDLDLFQPNFKKPARSKMHIIYIGRLVDVKRVDLLIQACHLLREKIKFHVDIVGDGPLCHQLVQQAHELELEDAIQFHGWLSQTAVADHLRDADVMVLPSMHDCGGAVVLEAMATGVPVIAANWGGPADYITPQTGLLLEPEDPTRFTANLAKSLIWLANNPADRAKMAEAARRRAAEHYDWRAKAKALLDIYNNVLNSQISANSQSFQTPVPEA